MLRQLSSLPLAIGELAVIALFSAIGTVIEQNRSLAYYMKVLTFSTSPPLLVTVSPGVQCCSLLLWWAEILTMHVVQNYPDGPDKVIGFVDWQLIKALQWDHIYSANYFLALMALLAASLAACTSTRQWPMVRVARRCAVPAFSPLPTKVALSFLLLGREMFILLIHYIYTVKAASLPSWRSHCLVRLAFSPGDKDVALCIIAGLMLFERDGDGVLW